MCFRQVAYAKALLMHASYNGWLVALSIAVAVLVSYTSFKLTSRIAEEDQAGARVWLAGGAMVMGIGIWSMHFIGMMALLLPIKLRYNVPKTLASLAIAIVVSGVAIRIASGARLGARRLGLGGLVMGAGICAMHYTGMAAIEVVPGIRYREWLVIVSFAVAVCASWGALWLTYRLSRARTRVATWARLGGAVLMGLAISGTHYVGMAATLISPLAHVSGGATVNSEWLAIAIAAMAFGIIALTLVTDVFSAELALRSRFHAHHQDQVNEQLRHQATHDSLTGLGNRQLFFEQLRSALREPECFAVMVVDLDRFKLINDSLGHGAGDDLLREVSRRLNTSLRKDDTVARVGGDEFLILARHVGSRGDATRMATKIVRVLANPLSLGALEVRASPSIGISLFPEDGRDADSLIAHADEAMYFAKRHGGNSFQCFSVEMSTCAQDRLWLENELRKAVPQGQLELHYQPRVDAFTGCIGSVEALVRWRHPQRGLLPPKHFIGIAEETGLIRAIGAWVVNEACRQASLWQAGGLPLRVAVNLSAIQFRQPDLLEVIREALSAHRLSPRQLELELTESAVMTNAEGSVAILEQLSRIGVVISLDDFGTGYSSMSYLQRLPIDKLKVDASFVQGLGDDPQSIPIVQAIISLAHSLNMKVIAEGVETGVQLEHLRSLGCDQCQGYYFGRPAPAEAIEAHLRATVQRCSGGGEFIPVVEQAPEPVAGA